MTLNYRRHLSYYMPHRASMKVLRELSARQRSVLSRRMMLIRSVDTLVILRFIIMSFVCKSAQSLNSMECGGVP